MNKAIAAAALGLALTGCAASGGGSGPAPRVPLPAPGTTGGAAAPMMGADAATLLRRFGEPLMDVQEGTARKLQFGNASCVLDAYLYQRGGSQLVTHVEARDRAGAPVDAASCAATLR
ncbi:hypothetical protein [Sphingosinithalassobacter sp. LHW66-3]|uniref:hypothetical protein n=1 Tax=Sphingosinithalassobacter sp. LHW66-3 TaxID=3424718 RepID=UPI003D6A42F2